MYNQYHFTNYFLVEKVLSMESQCSFKNRKKQNFCKKLKEEGIPETTTTCFSVRRIPLKRERETQDITPAYKWKLRAFKAPDRLLLPVFLSALVSAPLIAGHLHNSVVADRGNLTPPTCLSPRIAQ